MQLHPAVPRWKVCNDGRFREPVGAESLLLLRTVVPFVKMYLQHSLVNDGLLLLTRTQRHLVCPHHLEEVQHTFRKEEASEVLIYVDCFLVFHDYKGTSFLRIYLYSQTFTSYQTRKFASVPFYHYLCKGAIPPHLPGSEEQNLVVIEAFLEAAKRFARGGYDVIVDGIVGPWFLDPWKKAAQEKYEVHYFILRASKEETLRRAIARAKLDRELNIELVETMWDQFRHLGHCERYALDTTELSVEETVSTIQEKIDERSYLL